MKFRSTHIVDCFKREEIINEKLCDFLSKITRTPGDQAILQRWKRYFRAKGVPWIVTLTDGEPDCFVLWKQDERLSTVKVKREQKNPNVKWFCEEK